jgi:glycosyltransferase involved in cell wall biosynthesis
VRAPRFGRAVPTRWTRPLIVNAMRNFQADHGRRMGANDCRVTAPDMPSLSAIIRVFGSFRAATEAAYGSSLPPGGRLVAEGAISTVILNPPGHNQGQGVALNRLFSIASGDPIVKLDHDLTFGAGWLSQASGLLDAAPQIGLLGLMHYDHDPVDSAKTLIADHDGWSEHTHILGSAFAVRRACWEELGPFERHSESFSEDWAFQRAVTASRWCCALPRESLVENHGMGYGPSTVNVSEGVVQGIHTNPHLV